MLFRLMKLAAYGLFGYTAYEFIRGMMYGDEGVQGGLGGAARQYGQQFSQQMGQYGQQLQGQLQGLQNQLTGQGGGDQGQEGFAGRMNMSGPGEGREEATGEDRGTSVKHKVGRGVVG